MKAADLKKALKDVPDDVEVFVCTKKKISSGLVRINVDNLKDFSIGRTSGIADGTIYDHLLFIIEKDTA